MSADLYHEFNDNKFKTEVKVITSRNPTQSELQELRSSRNTMKEIEQREKDKKKTNVIKEVYKTIVDPANKGVIKRRSGEVKGFLEENTENPVKLGKRVYDVSKKPPATKNDKNMYDPLDLIGQNTRRDRLKNMDKSMTYSSDKADPKLYNMIAKNMDKSMTYSLDKADPKLYNMIAKN